jgi:hypothetical protein
MNLVDALKVPFRTRRRTWRMILKWKEIKYSMRIYRGDELLGCIRTTQGLSSVTERILTSHRRFCSVGFVISLNRIEVRSEHQRPCMTWCACVRMCVCVQDVKE